MVKSFQMFLFILAKFNKRFSISLFKEVSAELFNIAPVDFRFELIEASAMEM